MAAMQTMMWSLVIVSAVAVLVHPATLDVMKNLDDNVHDARADRSRRDVLPKGFLDLLRHLSAMFNPGSPTFRLLNSLSSYDRRLSRPQQDEPQVIKAVPPPPASPKALQSVVITSATCDPPCTSGQQCCLLKPGSSTPSCESMVLSGYACGWSSYYTDSNPSTTEAIHNTTCPCKLGMLCSNVSSREGGVCTFM